MAEEKIVARKKKKTTNDYTKNRNNPTILLLPRRYVYDRIVILITMTVRFVYIIIVNNASAYEV